MSGLRNSYQAGPLGVIEVGAHADMFLTDGTSQIHKDMDVLVDGYKQTLVILIND